VHLFPEPGSTLDVAPPLAAQVGGLCCRLSSDPMSITQRAQLSSLPIDPGTGVRAEIQASMVLYADGHREAFQPLFQHLWPLVHAFTQRALASAADAEDAAQSALLKVSSRVAEFDSQRDALGWVLGIAYYEVLTLRRKQQRRRENHGDAVETASPTISGEDAVIANELFQALETSLSQLPLADRELLLAAVHEDGSRDGVATPTTRKRKQRARERLRTVWRKLYGSL
jgi:RNA polymerase sigma factor (sigma-70 family)